MTARKRALAFVVTVVFVVLVSSVIGGQRVLPTTPTVPVPPTGDSPSAAPTPTAAIRGRIVAADTGRPLRRARVVVSPLEPGGFNRTINTGLDGRYEIKELPAGSYTVWVSHSSYLPLYYGQSRPLEQGKPLRVLDRQRVDDVDFRLPRKSSISGRITDEVGEPIANVRLFVMRTAFFEGRRRLLPIGTSVTTDDAGRYRVLNVVPGAYYVMAMLRETWTVTENGEDSTIAYAPTYFPGTNTFSDARRVTLGVSQQLTDADFSMIPGRAASISGVAVDSRLRPHGGGETVYISQEFRGPEGDRTEIRGGGDAPVAADGTFSIKNLPPGDYKIRMHVNMAGTSTSENLATLVSVNGVDVTDLLLVTTAGWSMSGQITTESGGAPAIAGNRFRMAARLLSGDNDPQVGGNAGVAQIKNDWTFSLTNVYGPARLRFNLPDGWSVKSVLHDGRDIGDQPIDLKSGQELSGVQVVVTNRVTEVVGQLADDKGAPVTTGTVIVFSSDATDWSEDSRFVRAARPDQAGLFRIRGLPPGDYLAVAIDYVPAGMWNDPEYLESIRRYGQRLTLADGGSQSVSLKLTSP